LAWKIEYDEAALNDLKKLDRQAQREILQYMEKRLGKAKDPRLFGRPLRHSKFALWRYRWREYRIICQLQDQILVVLVVVVGHRSKTYEENDIKRLLA
jgi:mRNA interferase RelE/StbE